MIKHARILLLAVLALALTVAAAAQAKPARVATTVTVTAGKPTEFGFKLSTKTVTHGSVTFSVKNSGTVPHDFKVCSAAVKSDAANSCKGHGTAMLSPGQSAKLTVTLAKAGKYEYLCTVAGHAIAGMKGILTVK
jgi:uncharacterized cupredoxin-like copper-binding protein